MVIMEVFKDGKLSQTSHSSGVLWVLDGDVLPSRTRTSFSCNLSDKHWKYCGLSFEGANWNPLALSRSMLRLHLTILSSPSSGSWCLIRTNINGFYWSLRNQDLPSSLSVSDKLWVLDLCETKHPLESSPLWTDLQPSEGQCHQEPLKSLL